MTFPPATDPPSRATGPSGAGLEDSVLPVRPRPVVVLGVVLAGLLVSVAAVVGDHLLGVAVLALTGLVVAAGWPALIGSRTPGGASAVLVVSTLALVLALLARPEAPFLQQVPAAVAAGIVAMCLQPLVQEAARVDLVRALAGGALGLVVLLCGAVLVSSAQVGALVGGVAVAVAALVDLALERPGTAAWMLPAAMLVGGGAGTLTHVALGEGLAAWPALVGVLCSGVAVCLRRALSSRRAVDTLVGGLAAGVASVLLVGPVLHVVSHLALG